MKKIIWITLLFVSLMHVAQAQGWERTYTSPLGDTTQIYSVIEPLFDNAFVFAGTTFFRRASLLSGSRPFVTKTNVSGDVIWQYNPSDLLVSDTIKVFRAIDGGFVVLATDISRLNLGLSSILVIKLSNSGLELSRNYYFIGNTFVDAATIGQGNIRIITKFYDNMNMPHGYQFQLFPNGTDTTGTTLFKNLNLQSIVVSDQAYIAYTEPRLLSDNINVMKIDYSGNRLWSKLRFGTPTQPTRLKRALDGRILVSGGWKLDYDGTTMWGGDFTSYADNNFSGYSTSNKIAILKLQTAPMSNRLEWYFIKQDSVGREANRYYFRSKNYTFNDIMATSDGGFIVVGQNGTIGSLIKISSSDYSFSNTLTGNVYRDSVQNCRLDVVETGFPNRFVLLEKNNETRWTTTDLNGKYSIEIDTGTYNITSVLPNANWRFCTPSVTKRFSVVGAIDTVNFAAQAAFYCPKMQVNAGTWGLRRCVENTYSVNYFNDGTALARNAYVEITIDSLMEFRRATVPLSSRVGQRLRFNVGDVNYGNGGRFDVTVYVKCGDSTRLNQTLCFESHVFPDTVCVSTTNWNGGNVVVTGTCTRDSVEFLIRNTGNAPTGNLRRIIIEDQVMLFNQQISLPANASTIYRTPANGSTWRMTVQQVPNNPRSAFATAFVEGCRVNATTPFSTGNVTTFPEADGDVAIDIQCLALQGSFDPNDKTGYPTGTGTNRLIGQNTDIEYLLRFQNTGNDTAFTVVLRDTLPPQLDIPSIETGASSHPYTWNLEGKGVLTFIFNNIRLVDSFRNEPQSHGFVKFRIKQKKDVLIGTKIENQAGIYFDFNAPVITNRTLHTIDKDLLLTATVEHLADNKIRIKVFPNPFSNATTFEMDPSVSEGIFELFDLNGKILRREKFENNRFEFQRQDLRTGIFIFKISTTDGRLIGNGKIAAQ